MLLVVMPASCRRAPKDGMIGRALCGGNTPDRNRQVLPRRRPEYGGDIVDGIGAAPEVQGTRRRSAPGFPLSRE